MTLQQRNILCRFDSRALAYERGARREDSLLTCNRLGLEGTSQMTPWDSDWAGGTEGGRGVHCQVLL